MLDAGGCTRLRKELIISTIAWLSLFDIVGLPNTDEKQKMDNNQIVMATRERRRAWCEEL